MKSTSKNDEQKLPVFHGMVFAFSGKFTRPQQTLKELVELGSGSCAQSVTQKVTHVITTQAALDSEKRAAALATAIGKGLPLVKEDFLSACIEKGKLVDMNEYVLRVQKLPSAEDEEREMKILEAISRKIENRVCLNMKRNVFYSMEDYASCTRMALERLRAMRRIDLLSFGFESLATGRALDRINQSMKDLRLDSAMEVMAARSLRPEDDARSRLMIDTNIYLDASPDFCSWLERLDQKKVKVFIPIAVFEELDKKRSNGNEKISFQARSTFRHIERALKRSNSHSLLSFWELQDRRVDDHYRRTIGGDARSFDLRILSFLRDCHTARKNSFVMVTEDRPLSLECCQHGIRCMSLQELLSCQEWKPPSAPAPAPAAPPPQTLPCAPNGLRRPIVQEQAGRGGLQRNVPAPQIRSLPHRLQHEGESRGGVPGHILPTPPLLATGANAIALGSRRGMGRTWDMEHEEEKKEKEREADLPSGWEVAYDRNGRKYYVDHINRKTFYASSLKCQEVRKDEKSKENLQASNKLLPPGWVQCVSKASSRPYFFNTLNGKSQWHYP
ncbi:hypothetical protein GUITHDRAFT_109542 [Guillardia theta CCMP2712]|uniref:WW domain-containing protein n=1 Tax=Guillardia theta (strain CCMP2712) TaxID=905079 RepID=L1J7C7_GUITC|nr:hypothetical protein GUITHDRAFT_109542 [Guillardia theta CCMP2712]EKX44421.1 hypothetical protein GUITHDRAFT_109542 [Guillardia theta CCMP2712]|eukprot:XP_005831401.1 hypothetical protein GUITHDRAFT_109542 [Guillardia theta CCMP2712]